MAIRKSNIVRFPLRRASVADLRSRLEVAELFISVLVWAKPDPVHSLTRSQRLRIADVARRTGLGYEAIMQRSVSNWLAVEAPVYLAHYDA